MKLKSHHIHARTADMGTADSGAAGLSMKGSVAPEKTAIAYAISKYFSARFIFPVISCTVPGMVFAGPEGGQVVAGNATISNPEAGGTLITQTTERAAIDWQRFNIGAQEYVQFAQPDANSVALNRVIGGDPSQILGNLSANGQVFLVNPNGIYFGHNATVDVGGLVASVNDIHNEDFLSGNYVFSKRAGSPEDAGVVNDGVISAHDGGYVVLMGDNVQNNGIISARLGTVALAAGNQITMDVKSNGLVSIAIDEEALSGVAGVEKTGEIMAAGGRVMMTAKVANDLIDTAINNEGLVVANSITERNGVIFLTAAGGDVVNSGTLDASAADDSNVGGGGVLVYSDKDVILASGAQISAKGDGSGDGGVIRVIAEDHLDYQSGALIDVTSDEGKGGFVEVSGHGSLAIRGDIDINNGGKLLIDPSVLIIDAGGGAPGSVTSSVYAVGETFIEGQLNAGVDVTLVASDSINASATLSIDAMNVSAGDLAIKIGTVGFVSGTGSLDWTTNCFSAGVCNPGSSGTFTADVNGSINLANVSFNLTGGLTVAGGTATGNVSLNNINAGGNVSITAADSFNPAGNTITAGGDVSIDGDIGTTGNLRAADLTISAGNNININSDIHMANNALVLAADKDGGGTGSVNINAASFATRTVSTQGNLNVSGKNFNVAGANANFVTNSQVKVQANNVDVVLSGDMNVTGGNYTPTSGLSTGTALVDVIVKAVNNMTINAASLNVQGGQANGNLAFSSGALSVDASAVLEAEAGNLTANLSGGLNVFGGSASASAMGTTGGGTIAPTVTVNANAAMKAGGDVTITANAADLGVGSTSTFTSFNGVANAAAKSSIQGDNVTLDVSGNMNALGGVDASFSAGNDIIVTVGGVHDVNSNYSAGNSVSLTAGSVLSLNNNFGSSQAVKNYNLTLGGQNIFINNEIYLGNNTLTLAGQTGTGTISIVNDPGSDLNVKTGGKLSITGHDLLVKDITTGSTGVLPSVGVEASTIDIALTGNMDVSAGSLTAIGTASGTYSVNASVTATNDITVSATNLNVHGGHADVQNTLVSNTQISANAKLGAGGNITIAVTDTVNVAAGNAVAAGSSGQNKTALADAEITAGGNLSITAKDITINGGSVATGTNPNAIASAKAKLDAGSALSAVASNNISGVAADVSAAGMYMAAGNNIDLQTSNVTVGNGTVAGITGDALTLAFLAANGIPPPTTLNPNAKFSAGDTLTLGTITMDGDVPYLWLEADYTSISGLNLPQASDVVVQYSPFTLSASIGVEDLPDTSEISEIVHYNNLEHFKILPGTTVIIGSSSQTGDINIGNLGKLDIGAQNMVFVTASSITTIDNVISTGIVAELLVGQFENEFVTPVLTEVEVGLLPVDDPTDEKEKKKNLVKDDEEEIKMCEAG